MVDPSETEKLYVAMFSKEPSVFTRETLHTVQRVMGLARDDELSQLLVVHLRLIDEVAGILNGRSAAEKTAAERVEELVPKLNKAAGRIEEVERQLTKRGIDGKGLEAALGGYAKRVDAYDKVFPMINHLRGAFYRRRGPAEENERIIGARWDFGLCVAVALLCMMLGAATMLGTHISVSVALTRLS
ncbi:hypothetical protein [Sphingomonas sp. BAUL-RG-20F-R05-02]|uniref:hypothetical protein n=1 Tax=Sphingomonas sp. BAUL-RG-20F-R05-02 TaxID=2914830 RepID=UPI001F577DA4|nr:hypothetical protein [Sphingomonas sp. BAUL-RG-20F-R05-02]